MTRSIKELTDAFEKGELDVDSLTEQEQKHLLNAETEEEAEEEETPAPVVEPEEPEPLQEDQGEEPPETPKKIDPKEKIHALKRDLYEKSNEANTYKQKLEALQRKLDAGEVKPKKPEIDRSKMWDDDFVATKFSEIEEVKAEIETLRAERAKLAQERELDEVYRGIADFQKQMPSLETKKPVKEINAVYVSAYQALGKEPTLEDMVEAGVPESDFKQYKHLLELDRYKRENGLKSYRAAFYDSGLAEKLDTTDPIEPAKRKATQESYDRAASRPKVMKGGYVGDPKQWDESTAAKWLSQNPDPSKYGAEDQKTFEMLASRFG